MNWQLENLGNLVNIISGFAFDSKRFSESEGTPLIRIRDVKRGFTNTYYKGEYDKAYLINKSDILIGMDGEFNLAKWDSIPALLNQRVCKIESSSVKKLDINYLFHFLPSQLKFIEDKASFVTVKHLSVKDIKNIQIPLPPLPTQRRIASILDTADTLRRKDQELLQKYDELAQAIFIDMFGDPVRNENGIPLNEIVKINPTKSEIEIQNNADVTFVPMANVGEDGNFNNNITRQYKEVKTGFTYFKEDDVLFAKITPCMENGKAAIAKGLANGVGFGSTEFHVLRPNNSLSSNFLFHLLHLTNVRKYAEMCMTGSAGQKRVPTDFFGKIKISIPEKMEQKNFIKAIENIKLQRQNIILNLEKSESLFQTLLQRSFSGELIA